MGTVVSACVGYEFANACLDSRILWLLPQGVPAHQIPSLLWLILLFEHRFAMTSGLMYGGVIGAFWIKTESSYWGDGVHLEKAAVAFMVVYGISFYGWLASYVSVRSIYNWLS